MKKMIFLFIVLIMHMPVQAQDANESNEIRTILDQTHQIGWWLSTDIAWTKFGNRDVFPGGMSGGIIVNHSLSIGLAGYGIMNSQNLKYSGINDTADLYLYGGYGGIKIEYRINPLNPVNVAFPLLIGGGGLAYSTQGMGNMHSNRYYDNTDFIYAWDGFFVIEPGVVIGLNLLKFMRLDVGISYRFAPGIDLPKTSSSLMNGLSANISLKFGRF